MRYHGKHINHEPNSLDSWHRRRLSPVVRNWLMDVVARSDNWETFRNLSRPDAETLEILESGGLTSAEPVSVSEIVRVRRFDFHNYRRRYIKSIAQYDDDCWKSLQKYGEQIEMHGGIALLRDLSLDHRSGKNHSKDFCLPFAPAGSSAYSDGIHPFFASTPRITHVVLLRVIMLHFYTQSSLNMTVRAVGFPLLL